MRHAHALSLSNEQLAQYLVQWRTKDLYARPESFPRLTAGALFGRPGELLSLEIGCGTGEYICDLAKNTPDALFLGTDINLKSLEIATQIASEQGLRNIRFIKAPVQWLYPLMQAHSLRAVYIHFADPMLLPKYRKRQLFTTALLDNLYRALVPGGALSIVTDNAELFDLALALVEADLGFSKQHEERYLVGFEPEVKSRYQQYWERHGKPILRLLLCRV